MDWLITIRDDLKKGELKKILDRLGCELGENPPIPLGTGEEVIQATGPKDLPKRVKDIEEIIQVYPNSGITFS